MAQHDDDDEDDDNDDANKGDDDDHDDDADDDNDDDDHHDDDDDNEDDYGRSSPRQTLYGKLLGNRVVFGFSTQRLALAPRQPALRDPASP